MATLKTQLLEYNDARSKNESEEREYAQEMEDIKDRISTLEQKRVFSDEQSVLQPEIDSRNEQLEIRRARTSAILLMICVSAINVRIADIVPLKYFRAGTT